MTSINLVLRPSSREGHHQGSLSVRVIHDRYSRAIVSGYRLYPEEWDAERQKIIYPSHDPDRTTYLEEAEVKIAASIATLNGIVASFDKHGRYSVGDVISRYRRKTDESRLSGYVESMAPDLERANQHRLIRAYRTVASELAKYNKGEDIPLCHINACLVKGFEDDIKMRGLQPNTISFYMRNLRAIYNKAVSSRRIVAKTEDPFAGVYTKVKTTAKRALTEEETIRMHDIDFDALRSRYAPDSSEYQYIEKLNYAWRLFMFCFQAQGMCFIDMAYLRKTNIKDGICSYYRQKTGQQIVLKVNKGMQHIIDSFAADVRDSLYLFPILKHEGALARKDYESALRTQNRRLKVLSGMAGVDKRVTTHVARHTFATITRGGGLPAGVISEMLGHTTERMTHNYFASLDISQFDQAYRIIADVLSGHPNHIMPGHYAAGLRI